MLKVIKIASVLLLAVMLAGVAVLWNLRTQPIHITPLMKSEYTKTGIVPQQKWLPLDKISPEIIRSVIACEDNNFFFHYGFDIEAIQYALDRNQRGSKVYGASTITQQTVKNVFLSPERTWARKGAELVLAVLVEFVWGKERIMEVYLNVIEMGENVYGIGAAAEHYFHKQAIDLTMDEAMMIAIALPNPKRFNPAAPSKYMRERQEQVYEMMNKLLKTGWYKNVKDIKQIKVNYLEAFPVVHKETDTVTNEVETSE
ncbi:hypothetical protein AGMMS4956_06930 [Bacteroidia bacterium]|nr:hypothetical protein AGMMS4956_06930 [Bacteroidia bacterium]